MKGTRKGPPKANITFDFEPPVAKKQLVRMGSKRKIQFEDFCQQTSIHGWSFLLFKGYGIFQILFWVTIIAGSFVSCMYMISLNLQEFKQATVEFETISLTENLDDIFFPSIFVINANQQRKSYLMAMIQENNLTEVLDVENLIQFYFDSSLGIILYLLFLWVRSSFC